MALLENSSMLGAAFTTMTTDVTGSIAMTLILLIIFILAIFVGFGIPTELSVIFIFPVLIFSYVYASTYGGTGALATIFVIGIFYLGIIFMKRGFFNS